MIDWENASHRNIYQRLRYKFLKEGKPLDGQFKTELINQIRRFEIEQQYIKDLEKPQFLEQAPYSSEDYETGRWQIKERQRLREIELCGHEQPKTYNPNGSYKTPEQKFPSENAITIVDLDEQLSYSQTGVPIIKKYKKKDEEQNKLYEDEWKDLV